MHGHAVQKASSIWWNSISTIGFSDTATACSAYCSQRVHSSLGSLWWTQGHPQFATITPVVISQILLRHLSTWKVIHHLGCPFLEIVLMEVWCDYTWWKWFWLNNDDAYLSIYAVLITVWFGAPRCQIESCGYQVINYIACVMASLGDMLLSWALDMYLKLLISYRNQLVPMWRLPTSI